MATPNAYIVIGKQANIGLIMHMCAQPVHDSITCHMTQVVLVKLNYPVLQKVS